MMKDKISLIYWVAIFSSIFTLGSCVNTKKVAYFNSISDTTLIQADTNLDPVIQKGDVLSIVVSSINPEVTAAFNAPNDPSLSRVTSGISSQVSGYLVSQDGDIQFPVLGNLKVAGMSKNALKDRISKLLVDKKLLFDPVVSIRYLNFHVTVLGEVGKPGLVMVPGEQVSLLEAIGLAGDLTIYGKRENVLLVRREDNKKIIQRLDLTSPNIFSSPYYYLRSNDVLYVEPNNNKVASTSQSRLLLPAIISGLSFFAIVVDRISR